MGLEANLDMLLGTFEKCSSQYPLETQYEIWIQTP